MPFKLGLTGSIGMGKSTTSAMFAAHGIPVWDADATVHRLYAKGGAAVAVVAALFPDAIEDDSVSRPRLRALIAEDPGRLDQLQLQIHPLVADDRTKFIAKQTADIVLLDIPLLFETGAEALCDGVAVVSASQALQRERVLARGQMTEAEFKMILARQMPDTEKRSRARWIIPTDTMAGAESTVAAIIAEIRQGLPHA